MSFPVDFNLHGHVLTAVRLLISRVPVLASRLLGEPAVRRRSALAGAAGRSCFPGRLCRAQPASGVRLHYLWARRAPLSMGVSRREHWSGLPLASPGELPERGWNPRLLCLLPSRRVLC